VITDAELTEVRYGGKAAAVLRGVKAVYFGTIFNCAVLSFVLLAATRIAEPFLTWDQWGWFPDGIHAAFVSFAEWIGTPITIVAADAPLTDEVWIRSANNILSILSILLVTTFYSTTGGLRSVVNTDIVQLFIMLVATAAFMWFVVDRVGGFGALSDEIHKQFAGGGPGGITSEQILAVTPSRAKDAGVALLAVFLLQWLAQMNADGTGYLAQRSMACRSDEDARRAAVWFTVTQILLRSMMWIPLGLGLLLMFPPDQSLGLEHARAESLRRVVVQHGHGALRNDRPGIVLVADEVHAAAGHLRAAVEHRAVHAVAVHPRAAERGQQRRMDVDHAPAVPRRHEIPAEKPAAGD
jgi:hypothetical protein